MSDEIDHVRRCLLGAAGVTIAAAQFGLNSSAAAQSERRKALDTRGFKPGTVFLLEPDPFDETQHGLELHGMNPMNVLRMVKSLGGTPGRVLIVGCEPAQLGSEHDGQLGLSEPVEAAVDEAIALIESLVTKVLDGEPVHQGET